MRDPAHRFEAQALLCTDLACAPTQTVSWFVRLWSVDVTFEEVRAHLGVETQRQWSDKVIARTTPCLLALFSIVTLLAARLPPPAMATHRGRRVVPKTAADLRRCARRRALCDLAREDFGNITPPTRPNKTVLPIACAQALCALIPRGC